jgi:CheY-like chemotaxis protein
MAQILVFEDDLRHFGQITHCIEGKGHKTWRAANVVEAVDFLTKYSIDLILSSVYLEKSDVFEVLRYTKNTEQLARIPFVFYCTDDDRCNRYATPVIMSAGKALGARKYITMPKFNPVHFWESLQECIPETAQKRDSLGGQVTTYSITDMSWISPERRISA